MNHTLEELPEYQYPKYEHYIVKEVEDILGIDNYMRTKLIKQGILVVDDYSEFKLYGAVRKTPHFTKQAVLDCWNDPRMYELIEARKKRSISAKKAVKTKTDKVIKAINKLPIKVYKHNIFSLKKDAIKAKQDWYDMTDQYYKDASEADQETVIRWIDNYIRHELTDYDQDLFELYGRTGKQVAYELLNDRITKEIQKKYPFYGNDTYFDYVEKEQQSRDKSKLEA